METRSVPEFQNEAQKELWIIRKEYARLTGFAFLEAAEEALVRGLDSDEAARLVAETKGPMEAFRKASTRKERSKRPAQGMTSASQSTMPLHESPS